MTSFSKSIVHWQPLHGRNSLTWKTKHPYDVWLSEIMLQQTQVSTVLSRFAMFKKRFPTVQDLANSSEEDVLAEWSGLGYYRRAKMLRLCAKKLVDYIDTYGDWPKEASTWLLFPGIGRSTAAAITSACFGEKVSILDANAKRVIARYHALDIESNLWDFAETLVTSLSSQEMPLYTQGLMDIGAMYCKARSTNCKECPLSLDCKSKDTIDFKSSKKASAPKLKITMQYALIYAQNKILMQQRGDGSFWPGMWTLPEISSSSTPSTTVRHLLSHRELDLQIYHLNPDPSIGGTWFSVDDIKNRKISVPSPFVKLLEAYA